jgi:predicted GNAT family N-acyltransferase
MSSTLPVTIARDANVLPSDVCVLFQHTHWAATRTEIDVQRMLANSFLVVSARRDGRLIGFGRAWGDGIYRAVLDDIVVSPDERHRGTGRAILHCLVRECSAIEELSLSCRPHLAPFYEALGFARYTGVHLKKPRQQPELTGRATP